MAFLIPALALPPGAAGEPIQGPPEGKRSRDVVLVANSEGGTVDVLDARRLRRVKTIDVTPDQPPGPAIGSNQAQDLDVSPDGKTLYVSRGFLSDVAAFSLRSGRMLWSVPIAGGRADHMTILPNGRRLFVTDTFGGTVEVISTRRRAIVASIPAGVWPHGVHLSPNGRTLYVGAMGPFVDPADIGAPHPLTVIDPRTLDVLRSPSFPFGIRPFQVIGKRRAVLEFSHKHALFKVDTKTGETLRRLPVPIAPEVRGIDPLDYDLAVALHGLERSPNGRLLCVAGSLSDWVGIVNLRRWRIRETVPVDDEPGWVTSSPDGRHCFATNRGPEANTVSVISYRRPREVKRIRTSGLHPQHALGARVARSALKRG